ncbi:GNAT family N-acetyltransferase [Aliamphritea spongicola]|uniref:GNAT family N-acetyltransferase n=1 Tax=Aliamphritea spongicola TaxID=707589 RepID=UPI00196B922D|nr:GNAT family N-acetyltransferase [Aliamphritea spongicola]MBN3563907.1 GNAT family N-acetyltransferase [Aliamphritea spongicola]
MVTTEWRWQTFTQLSNTELYEILALRQQVFVLEQTCLYADMDHKDQQCHHLSGWCEGKLQGYLRVVPPGLVYPEVALGRILTAESARGSGLGRQLVSRALDEVSLLYPGQSVRISAQLYLERFYAGFGFRTVSDPYDEDGIPHIEMLLQSP